MLQRFLLIWLILSSTIALVWPRIGLQFDPFLLVGGNGIYGLIVVVMFCIGTLLAIEEVDALFKRWPTVIVGTTIQYVSMPPGGSKSIVSCNVHPFSEAEIV